MKKVALYLILFMTTICCLSCCSTEEPQHDGNGSLNGGEGSRGESSEEMPAPAVKEGEAAGGSPAPEGAVPDGKAEGANAGSVPEGGSGRPEGMPPAGGEGNNAPRGMRSNDMSSVFDLFAENVYASEPGKADASDEEKAAARLENMKKQLNVPEGFTIVRVETGLSDDTYIEIKSGLTEGQIVLLPDTTQSNTNQQGMMGGGMPGGMPGGGMPGGGMPGGGMPGGGRTGGGMPGGGGMRR